MRPDPPQHSLASITAYLLCIGLVPLYVNLFPLWKFVSSRFGASLFVYLPLIVTVLMLLAMALARPGNRHHRQPPSYPAVFIGASICLAALIIPDPAFPVKRIHVAEYLLLTLLARFAMAPFLKGLPLLVFSFCFAALLGVHDEFLQGIHPARTYGLRDMTVNALACLGGGLLGHGLSLFSRGPARRVREASARLRGCDYLYPCWLLTTVIMLAVPALFFRGLPIDLWTAVPLIGSMVIFFLYRTRFHADLAHGITAVSLAAWGLAGYPLISAMRTWVFY